MSESDLAAEPLPLAVEADLTISVDDREYLLLAEDDVVTIVAPSIPAAVALLRSLPEGELDRIGSLVQTAGLTVVVRVGEETIATLDTTPQWVPESGGFDVRSVSVEPRALGTAIGQEVKAHPLAVVGVALTIALLVWWLQRRRQS